MSNNLPSRCTDEQAYILRYKYNLPESAIPDRYDDAQSLLRCLSKQAKELKRIQQTRYSAPAPNPKKKPKYYPPSQSTQARPTIREYYDIPYHDYMLTEAWAQRRKLAIKAACNRCQVCYSDTSLAVHHRTYERLGHELQSDLVVLCGQCHTLFHSRMISLKAEAAELDARLTAIARG